MLLPTYLFIIIYYFVYTIGLDFFFQANHLVVVCFFFQANHLVTAVRIDFYEFKKKNYGT